MVGDDAGLAMRRGRSAACACCVLRQSNRSAKNIVGLVAAAIDLLLLLQQAVMNEQTFVRAVVVELIEHVLDLAAGDVDAEVIAGDGFDRVGFVENHDVVIGQDADARAPQRDVAEQQRVIDDQNLCVLRRRRSL